MADEKDLGNRLKSALGERLKGAKGRIDEIPDSDRLSGAVVWDGFFGMDHVDRQRELWGFIRDCFNREDQLRISAILTYASEEVADDEAA